MAETTERVRLQITDDDGRVDDLARTLNILMIEYQLSDGHAADLDVENHLLPAYRALAAALVGPDGVSVAKAMRAGENSAYRRDLSWAGDILASVRAAGEEPK